MTRLRDALRLLLVTPGDRSAEETHALIEGALAGGVTAVLVREPQLDSVVRAQLTRRAIASCRSAGALGIVHRDVGLAIEVGADAVQLGFGSAPTSDVRRGAGALLLGRSAHWPVGADDRAADFVTFSPFAQTHRSLDRPLLTDSQVAGLLADGGMPPIVALGGLDVGQVARLPRGLAGIAVMRAIADARDPRRAAADLLAAVERSGCGSP